MNFSTKISLLIAAITASIFGIASHALAGEGGAAGSAAFQLNSSGTVTGVAVSAAIGKQDAFAGAFNDSSTGMNTAFAQGSAGVIGVNTLGSMTIGSISSSPDTSLGTAQGNSFTANTSVQIGSKSGDSVVNVKPTSSAF